MPRYRPIAAEFIAMEVGGDLHIELPDGTIAVEYADGSHPSIFHKLFEVVPAEKPEPKLEGEGMLCGTCSFWNPKPKQELSPGYGLCQNMNSEEYKMGMRDFSGCDHWAGKDLDESQ